MRLSAAACIAEEASNNEIVSALPICEMQHEANKAAGRDENLYQHQRRK